jgi:hypothetical protein
MEDRFEDVLKAADSDNPNSAERDSEKKYVERKLAAINARFGTDLVLTADKSRARIIPGGRFYQEFVSKFRGSQYIGIWILKKWREPPHLTGSAFWDCWFITTHGIPPRLISPNW